MRITDCNERDHAHGILEIFNDAIANSTALYEYEPRTRETIAAWFAAKAAQRLPVIGALDEQQRLLGFASYGSFRGWPAYKYSIEHSVYVRAEQRGRGVGRALLTELIERARSAEYHLLVAGIDLQNRASIALHEKLGFAHAGTIHQAGFKFGRWLDLAFYELVLDTPQHPRDGNP